MNSEVLPPLSAECWPDELREIQSFLGTPLNIHNMMAHHPELMKAWMPLRNHVVSNSSLSARQRELIILRTAHNCQADYEWQHHVERGLAAGLTRAEIEQVKLGADADGWQEDECALLVATDNCHGQFRVSSESRKTLDQFFSIQQQLDITVTVGMYITLALIIKTYDVPMEDS